MEKIFERVANWFRWYQKELILGGIIFMTATLSFGLGYLANRSFNHAPIIVEKCDLSN